MTAASPANGRYSIHLNGRVGMFAETMDCPRRAALVVEDESLVALFDDRADWRTGLHRCWPPWAEARELAATALIDGAPLAARCACAIAPNRRHPYRAANSLSRATMSCCADSMRPSTCCTSRQAHAPCSGWSGTPSTPHESPHLNGRGGGACADDAIAERQRRVVSFRL